MSGPDLGQDFFDDVAKRHGFLPEVVVETGTLHGANAKRLRPFFRETHTIELSDELYSAYSEELEYLGIDTHHGDSKVLLPELSIELRHPVLFYLDAHFCFDDEGAARNSFPIWAELECIKGRGLPDVVIVDDVHTFGVSRPDLAEGMSDAPDAWSGVNVVTIAAMFGERVRDKWLSENRFLVSLNGVEAER